MGHELGVSGVHITQSVTGTTRRKESSCLWVGLQGKSAARLSVTMAGSHLLKE